MNSHDSTGLAAEVTPHKRRPHRGTFGIPPSQIKVTGTNTDLTSVTVEGNTNIPGIDSLKLAVYNSAGTLISTTVTGKQLISGTFSITFNLPPAGTYVAKVYYEASGDPAGDVSGPFAVSTSGIDSLTS
jgi:hypothetical protein